MKNDKWIQGYTCATAIHARHEGGIDVRVNELIGCAGLTYAVCKGAGCDDFDLEVLFPKEYARAQARKSAIQDTEITRFEGWRCPACEMATGSVFICTNCGTKPR